MQTNNINGSGIAKSPFIDNFRKVRSTVQTELRKVFTIPGNDTSAEVKKTDETHGGIQKLDKVLSTEEKNLFELLFPVATAPTSTNRTFKSYAVQQKHTVQQQISNKRIVGSNLDIKG